MIFEWGNPWAFCLIPLLFGILIWRRQDLPKGPSLYFPWMKFLKTAPQKFSTIDLWKLVLNRYFLRNMFLLASLFCLIFVFAKPQKVWKPESSVEALDMVLVVDTSGSMRALDFEGGGGRQNRLDAVKSVIADFVKQLDKDRLALVVFGSEAFTQAPLTSDYALIQEQISSLQIGMAGEETAIGDAIAIASKRLQYSKSKNRLILLLTDGKNTAGRINPMDAAREAKQKSYKLYTIGIGKEGMVPFPVQGPFGPQIAKIESDLDMKALEEMASLSDGKAFRAYDKEELKKIYATIQALERSKIDVRNQSYVEDKHQKWLWASAVFFCIGILIPWLFWVRV